MAWTVMEKWRPLHPQSYEWLNVLSSNMLHLYNSNTSKSFAIPEPSRPDAKGSNENQDWDDAEQWSTVDEVGVEYVFVYDGTRRYLWYRYALRSGVEPNDKPHITFGMDFGSSRHEDGYDLPCSNGGDAWNVHDLVGVKQLIPGMIVSVHTVRCAMLRSVSS